jgi:long-chain fatty acid transport protein
VNLGWGIANQRLCDGRLLLAADVLYKLWDEADLYSSVYDNQWVFQFGSQYSVGKYRLRAGYAYAQDPIDPFPLDNVGGVFPPGGPPAVRYTQALVAVTSQHRMSFGVGIVDAMPGVDLDFMAGGMFHDDEQLGPTTSSSVESYWIGTGLTWRFGACGRAGHTPAP